MYVCTGVEIYAKLFFFSRKLLVITDFKISLIDLQNQNAESTREMMMVMMSSRIVRISNVERNKNGP